MHVDGGVALVTGGQRGIGAAFATELLQRGASKVYVTAREPQPSQDPRILPLRLELTDPTSVRALLAEVGDISILVNNAGIGGGGPLLTADADRTRLIFETNVLGTLRISAGVAAMLGTHSASAIVTMLSTLSWAAGAGAYGASKAALWSLNNTLRLELAQQNTQVLGVHVGLVDTDLVAGFPGAKLPPATVAATTLDALEDGRSEVLVDDAARRLKAALSGPVEGLSSRP